ncbi:MAG: hypothetical protein H7Y00_13410, partial [Fimbriimonadaceae bacterium]|nr:hypothetical protein [Chitinophagales bacterium]
MNNRNKLRIFFCVLLCPFMVQTSFSQVNDSTGLGNDIIESIVENESNIEGGLESYEEGIEALLKNPININTASYYELINTGLFTDVQCRNLMQH